MNLANLSVKRPIFIACVVVLMLQVGYLSLKKLPVDLFPNVTFPVVMVNTIYAGAGPKEIETLVSKPIEDEMSTLPGIKTLRSINKEGISTVIAEFTLETDIKFAEQQTRDRVSSVKSKIPEDAKDPVIRRLDPSDQPILILSLKADLKEGALFDLADQTIRPKIEQINQVGMVQVVGGRKREIRVDLDRNKLKARELSSTQISNRLQASGQDVPVGSFDEGKIETVFRTLGEFKSLKDIEGTLVSFFGNDVPVKVSDVGTVIDTLVDEKSRTYVNGEKGLLLMVFRQSGANTIAVADAVIARVQKLNAEMGSDSSHIKIGVVRDSSKMIRANVTDVKESIFIGILLTIIVVFFFLGNARSTLITGLALPNSLLGAFILMSYFGFTINIMTLLALSLSVGLLIDDAIVVRENIFRHLEMGMSPIDAALNGTKEVALAVIATTLTVIAVFGPIAFLKGVVGQFFREFGLTICFAMLISLFDAFTMAPMLSAYLAGRAHSENKNVLSKAVGVLLQGFNRFQDFLEDVYEKVISFALKRPFVIIGFAIGVFWLSIMSVKKVPKTFLPPQDFGEFSVALDMAPGTSLSAMAEMVKKVDQVIRANKEVETAVAIVGGSDGGGGQNAGSNVASFFVELVPGKQRKMNTSEFKEILRGQLKGFTNANPVVKDIDNVGGGMRPFNVNIIGTDLEQLEQFAQKAFVKIKAHPGLKDVDISHRPGKPEAQVVLDRRRAEALGISTIQMGLDLRTQIEGSTPAVFRENGLEYDIRVRLKEEQRNLKEGFAATYIPNINFNLIRLADVGRLAETTGPANINRQDRGRYIQISGDLTPGGVGMGGVMTDLSQWFTTGDLKVPPGLRFAFVGQAENFKELGESMVMALGLGILFIYLVLASLYESFVIPLTIMLVLPLAACGAFFALLITGKSLDLFSMIGCVMLLGIATKNSILLVDYANLLVAQGVSRSEALIKAGRTRLRPILMTTVALIAGMLPVAIGLNEASKQRTSMGAAIIGGLISSTVLSLIVVPAVYSYIDRFRVWSRTTMSRIFGVNMASAEDSKPKSRTKEALLQ